MGKVDGDLRWLARWRYPIAFLCWGSIYVCFRFNLSVFPLDWRLSPETHGQIGDLFGAFTCLFSVVAALESIATNRKQTEELEKQREFSARSMMREDYLAASEFLSVSNRFAEDLDVCLSHRVAHLPDLAATPLVVDSNLFKAVENLGKQMEQAFELVTIANQSQLERPVQAAREAVNRIYMDNAELRRALDELRSRMVIGSKHSSTPSA